MDAGDADSSGGDFLGEVLFEFPVGKMVAFSPGAN